MKALRCALWCRTSTTEQNTDNQQLQLRVWADKLGYDIVTEYILDGASAWKGQHQSTLQNAITAARRRAFDVLLVWAADRLTREGIEDLLRTVRLFKECGVQLRSMQEPWFDTQGPTGELLLAIAGWLGQQESARKSERVKAALERRRQAGLPVGRQPGARDAKPRKRSGYVARWERERASA